MIDKSLAKPEEQVDILALLDDERIVRRFKDLLGDHAPAFIASVANMATTDLSGCEPKSVLMSAFQAAALDLPVSKNLGYAWIIPYNERNQDGQTTTRRAEFQVGYRGYIQLALRTNQYEVINVTEIYQGEIIIEDRLTGEIKISGKKLSDQVLGYAGYFRLKGGFQKYIYMSVDQIDEHAKRYSKSWGRPKSAWTTNKPEMSKKTIIRLLIPKYGIMSIQMQTALGEDIDFQGDQERSVPSKAEIAGAVGEVIDHEEAKEEKEAKEAQERPYLPDVLKARIAKEIEDYTRSGGKAKPVDRNMIAVNLELALESFPAPEPARKSVMEFLVGKESVKNLLPAEVLALKKWLDAKPDDNQDWHPSLLATQEAVAVYNLFLSDDINVPESE